MTIGSIANIATAFEVIRKSVGPGALSTEERLALVLLSDSFGMGACEISIGKLHGMMATEDPSITREALERLAARGLIRLSDWQDYDTAFAASSIASDEEIEHVRRHLECNWPFREWKGGS
ncbi:hypothetical protein [Mesorhizobium sp. KR9-304]|uniref:hypothetical protein n=1 Tax=Mesorhizobium sp. KR9-304 TaxID=3156614 RepID=UPI0032B5B635